MDLLLLMLLLLLRGMESLYSFIESKTILGIAAVSQGESFHQ